MARTKVFDEQEILDKAMKLFWEKGYNATSAQDLVESLGISRSSLYDTFGDKHSLFVKALQQYRKERVDPVLEGADKTNDFERFIASIFDAVKEEALSPNSSKGCFMVNSIVELASVDSEVGKIGTSILIDTENALSKVIRKGQQQGVFTSNHSARSLARFVLNSLNGLRVTVKLDANKKVFDDVLNVCLSALRQA